MNDKALKYKKLYYVLMIAVILVSFIPLLVIGVHNRPSADDFNYAIDTFKVWNQTHSIFATIEAAVQTSVRFLHTWQGLYASAFLLALQPAIFGSKWYAMTGVIMMFLSAGSAVFFSCYVLKRLFKRTWLEGTTLGLVMTFLMIQYMPFCVEGIYWFNGAVNYVFFMQHC